MSKTPSCMSCSARVCEYVTRNHDRLLAERRASGDVVISSILDSILFSGEVISLRKLYEAKSNLWEEFHSVHWKDARDIDRELFGIVSCMIAALLHQKAFDSVQILQILDCGLLLGSERTRQLMNEVMTIVKENRTQGKEADASRVAALGPNLRVQELREIQSHRRMIALTPTNNPSRTVVATRSSLDLFTFRNKYFISEQPVVIQDCMEDWQAMHHHSDNTSRPTNWASIPYLLDVLGHRTVPIETGSTYLSEDSGSCFVTGEEFVRKYILGQCHEIDDNAPEHQTQTQCAEINTESQSRVQSQPRLGETQLPALSPATALDAARDTEREMRLLPLGYLAQHQLLEQVPELRRDIITPDYCALLLDVDEEQDKELNEDGGAGADEVLVNAWLGPVGTVSPLHHDPYYNLLAQTAGYKYVRLYAPEESSKLYAMSGRMSNNSEVNLLMPRHELYNSHPLVESAQYMEYMLGPGEMLFIPRWWWHFIVAIDRTSALEWRSKHQREHNNDTICESSEYLRNESGRGAGSEKRRRLELQLPPPVMLDTSKPDICDVSAEPNKTSELSPPDDTQNTHIDYSFSVSFWWGKRILKK